GTVYPRQSTAWLQETRNSSTPAYAPGCAGPHHSHSPALRHPATTDPALAPAYTECRTSATASPGCPTGTGHPCADAGSHRWPSSSRPRPGSDPDGHGCG